MACTATRLQLAKADAASAASSTGWPGNRFDDAAFRDSGTGATVKRLHQLISNGLELLETEVE
jgi:hypothetical protein